MNLCLNGDWTLSWHAESADMPAFSQWPSVPAKVPGNVELDLFAAGVEPEPFYAENADAYRKYEYCAFLYSREFLVPASYTGARLSLRFEGLNNIADIYVNGRVAGHAQNAMIAHEMDVTELIEPGRMNQLSVLIHSAMRFAADEDYPVSLGGVEGADEYVRLRMPPHSFGWDIMPRFLSAGLWRGVFLDIVKPVRITQTYFATLAANEDEARLLFEYRFCANGARPDAYTIRLLLDGETVYERPAHFVSGEATISLQAPRLWWPRGYGEAALYAARTELIKDGAVVDAREERIGLRVIQIEHAMCTGGEGEFLIRVNGCPILVKGSNWVPLDAMHSRDEARYARAIGLFVEAGCNMARCWGGNVYEDHPFFDLCDENGIMVWQDFAMACAIYPQDENFKRVMFEEAEYVIRKLRNHACIALWAGDNEVDEAYTWRGFVTRENCFNEITRNVLPRAVRLNDPYRMFLPSSPYIEGAVGRYQGPEQHLWGPRGYFKDEFYLNKNVRFVSECGYHGCPAPESLKKYIPEAELWPMGAGAWRAHNTETKALTPRGYDRNKLMADQVCVMFGRVPDTLDAFSFLSQTTQAEAIKFFIELTRARKWQRTGILWWNMLDGWPQISDAVVDWYFVKKRAFSYIRRSQAPITLIVEEASGWERNVILANDSRETVRGHFRVTDADTNEVLLEGECVSRANENQIVGRLRVVASERRLMLLSWTANGHTAHNHCITGFPPYDEADARRWCAIIDRMEEGEA